MESYKLYVSGYSNDYAGIYQVEFKPSENKFQVLSTNNESINPIHILIQNNLLFSANEIEGIGRVSSFKIEKSGALRLVNRIDGPGSETCDITIGDNVVYAANYGSGNIFSVPFESDGNLIEVMTNMEHVGDEPRAHSTILTKDGKHLYEANLGNDRIYHYEVFPEGVIRVSSLKASTKLDDFEGPRHMTIDSSGNYLYIVNEFGNSVYSYKINGENGDLEFIEKIRLVEEVESYAADIHFSLSEKYLYVSLRGSDEIALIEIDRGKMEFVEKFSTGGKWPRSFKLSNDGKYLFVTNQNSNNITALKIDLNNGHLSEPVASLEINQPTSIATY